MRFLDWVLGWLRPPKTLDDILHKYSIKTSAALCDCPDGWLRLVDQCFSELIAHGWNRELFQVKEKFGGLRVYLDTDDQALFSIIRKYEHQSHLTCVVCGNKALEEVWNQPKCTSHR